MTDHSRGERLNIGIVVLTEDGLDIVVTRRLDKIRGISSAISGPELEELAEQLRGLDDDMRVAGTPNEDERLRALSTVRPLAFSAFGTFTAEDRSAYETRLASIMRAMVDPEPAKAKLRLKRSRILSQMKAEFRRERVLAQRGEDLTSHRIVSSVEMDEGLVADLVLKNGEFHVVETVDALSGVDTIRRAISEIGIAALVFERAKMKFGEKKTATKLVYATSSSLERAARPSLEAAAHQGAELVNWASSSDRGRFIRSLTMFAEPLPRKREGGASAPPGRQLRFM